MKQNDAKRYKIDKRFTTEFSTHAALFKIRHFCDTVDAEFAYLNLHQLDTFNNIKNELDKAVEYHNYLKDIDVGRWTNMSWRPRDSDPNEDITIEWYDKTINVCNNGTDIYVNEGKKLYRLYTSDKPHETEEDFIKVLVMVFKALFPVPL